MLGYMNIWKGDNQMNNNTILTRVFTRNTLNSLIVNNNPRSVLASVVKRYNISYDAEKNNEQIISEIYECLDSAYRNEYFYKNTLLNKLIISAHRLKTTTALTEVPVAKSKADFIMINGKAVVYEIKTELDTFERLDSQINDYYKAFDHVCVVTSETQAEELILKFKNSPIGIYALSNKNILKRVKEPEEYRSSLSKEEMFKILNKPEYESIIRKIKEPLPNVTPVNYYRECKRMLCDLPLDSFYNLYLKELKKRSRIDIIDFELIPYSLRFLVYFSKYDNYELSELHKYLEKPFKEGI